VGEAAAPTGTSELSALSLMIAWRAGKPRGNFQRRGFEAVDPGMAGGRIAVPETAAAPAGD
jgi:hypothetical protein